MLYDRSKAGAEFTPGVYVTDGEVLWRILDLAERRKGLLPLEDCHFPYAPPLWRSIEWLMTRKVRVIRPG